MSAPRGEQEQRDELTRWGLRFVSPAVEAEYAEWRLARTSDAARAGLLAATAAWGIFLLALWATPLPEFSKTLGAAALDISVCLLVAAGTRREGLRRWLFPGSAAANFLAGLAVLSVFLGAPDSLRSFLALVCGGSLLVASYFACAILRTPPRFAIPVTALYIAIFDALVGWWWATGSIALASAAVAWGFTFCAIVVGTLTVLSTERMYREAFCQERIIAAQRAKLEQQQQLLERELSHQVAERSRELGAALAMADVTLAVRNLSPGERFAERYKIQRELGAGGMGVVFEVERVTDGARLALKAVVGEVSSANAARFAREAEIGARVRHRNLVSIVDVGVATGVPYLVMELVQGGSLEQQRARFGDVAWALELLRQIARGMTALHDAGVVHRDLKPANVLLDGDTAKISDFGISRFGAFASSAVDEHAETVSATPRHSPKLTGTGVLMGTPLYMAPEAARSARKLDASADVFAFGILAYELLTGRAPFEIPAFLLAVAQQPIPSPQLDAPGVSEELRALVGRALRSDPTERPAMRALLAALE